MSGVLQMPLKLKAKGPEEKRVLAYLEENASAVLRERINAGTKTIADALSFACGEAELIAKESNANCLCVDDATVFGWVVHFFEEDDVRVAKTKARTRKSGKRQRAKGASADRQGAQAAKTKAKPVDMTMDLFAGVEL